MFIIYILSLAAFATTAGLNGFNTKPKTLTIGSFTEKVYQALLYTMASKIASVHPALLTPKVLVSLCHDLLV